MGGSLECTFYGKYEGFCKKIIRYVPAETRIQTQDHLKGAESGEIQEYRFRAMPPALSLPPLLLRFNIGFKENPTRVKTPVDFYILGIGPL